MSEQISNCEQCLQRYTLFRRRKQCDLCGQTFCSKCILKASTNNPRACPTCSIIVNVHTTHDQLALIRVKHLRAYLIHSKVISLSRLESCFEKQDLINLIESRKRQTPDETYVFIERSNGRHSAVPTNDIPTANTRTQQQTQEATTESNEETPSPIPPTSTIPNESRAEPVIDLLPPPKVTSARKTLADLSSLESIDQLTVGQLKSVLTQNFVSFTGCIEKHELINKVQLLYRDKQQQNESTTSTSAQQSDENLCKICMDASIDCVFLNCGHLCTCVQCGKKLSECPICRTYIIRVVRVFKS